MPIGDSIPRLEDAPLLTGQGTFVADLRVFGMGEAVIVRSTHAHARIRKLDLTQVRARPNVWDAFDASDLPTDLERIPMRLSPSDALRAALQPVLAEGVVRYVGEPVAVIVAADRYAAEDALRSVVLDYEPLPPVLAAQPTDGAPDARLPALFSALPDNVVYDREVVRGDPDGAWATVPHRLHLRLRVQRHTGVPLETRGLLAIPSERGLTVYGATKVTQFNRLVLAHLLKMDVDGIRFVEVDVGGGFGVRGEFYPEDFLVPYAALRLGRPVRWIEDRREHMMATNHSREQEHDLTVGFDEDGHLLVLSDAITVDTGAYIRTHGVTVPELTQAMLPGPYRWPHLRIDLRVVLTNKTPTGTYRGPGRFEGTFVRERVVEAVARQLHLDPVDVRRRNLIEPDQLPFHQGIEALGEEVVFDSGRYGDALTRARELLHADTFEERQRDARAEGRRRGLGWALFVEKSGLGPYERARVALRADGRVECLTGLAALGQGTVTMLAQVVSDALGIGESDVTVVHGDTDRVPEGGGSFASRGTVVGGSAAYLAAAHLARTVRGFAADLLEADPADVELGLGGARVRGVPARALSWAEIGRRAEARELRLEASERFDVAHMTYPYGVHGAEVEVDPGTGAVRIVRYGVVYDVGRAIHPKAVEGQILGGLAQGLGGALLEELVYDKGGQLVTQTFMDYLIPTACEVPDVAVLVTEDAPSPHNPLGVKGAGEGGTVGAAPALANALADALQAPPEAFSTLPIRPETVLHWLHRLHRAEEARPRKGVGTHDR